MSEFDVAPAGGHPYVRLCALADLPPGSSLMEQIGDYDVACFNVRGELYAIDDMCPHQGGPLRLGTVDEDAKSVMCPWHGWRFNLTDGKMNPGRRLRVATFEVKVENGDVLVSRMPRPPVPESESNSA